MCLIAILNCACVVLLFSSRFLKLFFLFVFGCAGSSLLQELSRVAESGDYSSSSMWASFFFFLIN